MALIKKENICVVVGTYEGKDGHQKNKWRTIGELLTFDGKNGGHFQVMELYHMPGIKISLFEQKVNGQQGGSASAKQQDEVRAEDVNW